MFKLSVLLLVSRDKVELDVTDDENNFEFNCTLPMVTGVLVVFVTAVVIGLSPFNQYVTILPLP